jgi:hypothetical protein
MNTTEDRLRAAALAAAGTVAPGSAPPLHLPDQPARRFGVPGPPHRRGWRRWAAPLAAAASVIAVVAASLAITSGGGARARPPVPSGPETAPARAAALASVPPYYLTLTGYSGQPHLHAVLRASATGSVLASVTPPRPYGTFTHVSGAADDRTFVLAAQRWVPVPTGKKSAAAQRLDNAARTKFFLLRFSPTARTARLTALPVPMEPGGLPQEGLTGLAGIALSPDGSKLAIAIDRPAPLPPEITVASVATGSERTWVWQGKGWIGDHMDSFQPLSWAADGRTLAFQQGHGFVTAGARLLDTDLPGGNLRSSSRPAAQWHFAGDNAGNIAITPDGSKIIAPVTTFQRHPSRSVLQITEFSATTGKMVRVAGHWQYAGTAGGQDILWTNPSGSTLIVISPDISPAGHRYLPNPPWAVSVLTGDQLTPLPRANAHYTGEIAW